MVLKWLGSWKDATEYTFANTRSMGLKFWHNVDTYSSHLLYECQWAAAFIVQVTTLLCVFEMVLNWAVEYTFCDNFADTRDIGLKFWYNVGTYSGHLWCEFQWATTSIVEVIYAFCVFLTLSQICS